MMFKRLLAVLLLSTPAAAQTLTSPASTSVATPAAPPTPPVAPLVSRLYAGASYAPAFGSTAAYGIVVGSTQVFGPFGAQVGIDFVTKTGAISVDAALLYRLKLASASKVLPYAGLSLGLTSSAVSGSSTTAPKTATDYAAQVIVGSDYLLTDSIAASAELSYRSPFTAKGSANGAGLHGRLGLKFLF